MKITRSELVEAMNGLTALGQRQMPNVIGYKLFVLRKKLKPFAAAYNEGHAALVQEHRLMKDGQVVWLNPEELDFSKRLMAWKDTEAWDAAIKAYLEEEIDVGDLDKLTASELGPELPPVIMYQLGPLLA